MDPVFLSESWDSIIYLKLNFKLYSIYVFKSVSMKFKILKKYTKPHYTGKNSTFRIQNFALTFYTNFCKNSLKSKPQFSLFKIVSFLLDFSSL